MKGEFQDPACERLELRVPPRWRELGLVREFVALLAREHPEMGFAGPLVEELKLVLQEACMNAIRHAKNGCHHREGLRIVFLLGPDRLTIDVHDKGSGFDPGEVPEPDLENLQEGGYGVYIMKRAMDEVEAVRTPEGFVLRLVRRYPMESVASGER